MSFGRNVRFASLLIASMAIVTLVGCSRGGSAGLTRVTGEVKLNGQPLKSGTITFMPVSGTTSSTGEIKDGRYSLGTTTPGDGAPAGEYKVSVTAWEKLPTMTEAGVPAVPEKYMNADTSGLTAKVESQRSQTIDFDLQP
jgi:hypothetical protein